VCYNDYSDYDNHCEMLFLTIFVGNYHENQALMLTLCFLLDTTDFLEGQSNYLHADDLVRSTPTKRVFGQYPVENIVYCSNKQTLLGPAFLSAASQLLAIVKTDSRVRERKSLQYIPVHVEKNLRSFFFSFFSAILLSIPVGNFKFMINNKSMDKQLLESLKKKLEDRKISVIEQLGSIGHQETGEVGAEINFNADFPDYGDSAEDNAVEVADYAKNLSVERELEKDLRDVEKSLKKIADGTYGTCSHCGEPIEIERLKIRPESGSCVSCKNAITRK